MNKESNAKLYMTIGTILILVVGFIAYKNVTKVHNYKNRQGGTINVWICSKRQQPQIQGKAPFAAETQHYGARNKYELHHKTPIHAGGAVYDLSNIVIVTPRYHVDILSGSYHYGH